MSGKVRRCPHQTAQKINVMLSKLENKGKTCRDREKARVLNAKVLRLPLAISVSLSSSSLVTRPKTIWNTILRS